MTQTDIAAQYNLGPELAPDRCVLQALPAHSRHPRLLAAGTGNVADGTLGTW